MSCQLPPPSIYLLLLFFPFFFTSLCQLHHEAPCCLLLRWVGGGRQSGPAVILVLQVTNASVTVKDVGLQCWGANRDLGISIAVWVRHGSGAPLACCVFVCPFSLCHLLHTCAKSLFLFAPFMNWCLLCAYLRCTHKHTAP